MSIDRRAFGAGALGVLLGGRFPQASARAVAPARPVVTGYVASWKVREDGPRIADIPAREITHLNYAFGSVSEAGFAELVDPCLDAGVCGAGGKPLAGNFGQLLDLKRVNPELRLLISLGGWNGSKYFSDAAATPAARSAFARSVVEVFVRGYPGLFDGVDIDWEYPVSGGAPGNRERAEDRRNFTLLIAELRRNLAEPHAGRQRKFELTIAVPADPAKIANAEMGALARLVDRINMMAYDYHAGSTLAGFNAPLFSCAGDPDKGLNADAGVKAMLRAGVPPGKLVLGLPFYGRALAGVPEGDDGLFQQGSAASEEWGGANGIDYRDIVARQPEQQGFRRRWSEEAKVPWLYNPERRIFISYEDPRSVAAKAAYARTRGMAGVMIWDMFADDGSLLAALRAPRTSVSE